MKQIIDNLMLSAAMAAILAGLPVLAFSQFRLPAPPEKPERIERVEKHDPPAMPMIWGGDTSEKSIKVDSSINLSLCITQGTVKVNGWNRNEVRVYVQDGSKFGFNVREKSSRTGDPIWIKVMGVAIKGKYGAPQECISGNEIEIDVPVNATIGIRGNETTTTIDTVRKVEVKTVEGDITLRNISGGIFAYAGQGDVSVEASTGAMMLETTTGNILVFEASPSEIGDSFKAKTNGGTISLQDLRHRQVEVGSISGSVLYSGVIRNGGSYNLSTSKGSIRMLIPADSACQLQATFGAGNFSSDPELGIKLLTENVSEGPIKSIVGKLGTGGDAAVKLTTNNGSISIRKQ